jgi:hypothetical protein
MTTNPLINGADARALEMFNLQTRACQDQPVIPLKSRLSFINTIEEILKENDQAICKAIQADFGNRSFHEGRILFPPHIQHHDHHDPGAAVSLVLQLQQLDIIHYGPPEV